MENQLETIKTWIIGVDTDLRLVAQRADTSPRGRTEVRGYQMIKLADRIKIAVELLEQEIFNSSVLNKPKKKAAKTTYRSLVHSPAGSGTDKNNKWMAVCGRRYAEKAFGRLNEDKRTPCPDCFPLSYQEDNK